MAYCAADIQKIIAGRFDNHKYDLFNSYIFNGWECDFFSVTDSGYCYETEIKISRSDFFADFKKDKHNLFKRIYAGEAFYWENRGLSRYHGSEIGRFENIYLINNREYRRHSRHKEVNVEDTATHADYLNQYKHFNLESRISTMHAPCTSVRFVDLAKVNCPNRFYYAVPKDLIKVSEIPVYAGLIYVDGYSSNVIKQAPFLHKRVLDIKAILLEKFYYETKQLRRKVEYQKL